MRHSYSSLFSLKKKKRQAIFLMVFLTFSSFKILFFLSWIYSPIYQFGFFVVVSLVQRRRQHHYDGKHIHFRVQVDPDIKALWHHFIVMQYWTRDWNSEIVFSSFRMSTVITISQSRCGTLNSKFCTTESTEPERIKNINDWA